MNARSLARIGSRFAAAAVALLAGLVGYGLHAARAEGIPSGPAMYYSGTLEENGVAVEGVRSMALRLYDGPESSRPVLCESVPPASGGVPGDVTVRGGRFRFEIGDDCVSVMRAHPNVLAELVVGGTPLPRAKVGAVPYAVEAEHALRANEATHAANADTATNATHATNADTATNASHATTATSSTSCADLGNSLHVFMKGGNNGTQSCDTYCEGKQWGATGTCVGARLAASGEWIQCGSAPGSLVACFCSQPQ